MTTTSERALTYLPASKTTVVGYPVRDEFWTLDGAAARARLSLPPEGKVLLVTAGSLGAQKINAAITASLPAILGRATVVHVTGTDGEAAAQAQRATLTPEQQQRYLVHGYLDDMPAAMVAADLVVSRAGASSLGELPAAGAPSILVPGEYEGWSQAPNAEYMQSAGAAVMLRNADLDRVGDLVLELLDDELRLRAMGEAARALARPDAARDLARVLVDAARPYRGAVAA